MRIELGRMFERIRLLAEFLAHRWRARRQRPVGRRPIAIAFARHRALAADIDRAECVELTGFGNADGHAVLLLHSRIGLSWFHPAKLNRQSGILIEIRQQSGYGYSLGRKLEWRACANYS